MHFLIVLFRSTPIRKTLRTQMLSSIVRTTAHRQPEVKSRRGWEKTSALSSNTTSPWVARQLVDLLGDCEREHDSKVGPIAQLVIECLLTLISWCHWWMLYYLLLLL